MVKIINLDTSVVGACPECRCIDWRTVPVPGKMGTEFLFEDIDHLKCVECGYEFYKKESIIFEPNDNLTEE